MKHNDQLTFQCYWGVCSDAGLSGTILSCNVAATHGYSSHNCVTKVNKQVEAKIMNFCSIRDQRKIVGKQGNSQKVMKQGRSLMPTDILVDI